MVDSWEVALAKPAADQAPELPRMEDDNHEVWAEASRKTSVVDKAMTSGCPVFFLMEKLSRRD
jgi:hypothetical protein